MALSKDQIWLYSGFLRAMRHIMIEEDKKRLDNLLEALSWRELRLEEEVELGVLFHMFDKKEPNG